MIEAHLSGDKIISNMQEAFTLNEKSCLGEKKSGIIEYSPIEALFLLSRNKMHLFSGKKEISFYEVLKKIRKQDKKIETKFAVFSDLRKKGYILKSALKFGAEFRVYDIGSRPSTSHAKWLLYTAKESDNLSWHEFSAKNRVAHSTKKNLMIAILDEEGDISYYEISWLRT